MTMHTELYCTTLDSLDRVQAVRAIHQAYLQLRATAGIVETESYDNWPAVEALADCLAQAGHPSFIPIKRKPAA